jgi:PhnB protein
MPTLTTTHVNFRTEAREALEFYAAVSGGRLALVTYADAANVQHPADADRIMWGQVESDDGFRVMAYDVPEGQPFDRGTGSFFVSLRGTDEAELTRLWEGLSDGGQALFPLGPAPWGAPLYGMLVDRFGITWVLDIAVAYDA